MEISVSQSFDFVCCLLLRPVRIATLLVFAFSFIQNHFDQVLHWSKADCRRSSALDCGITIYPGYIVIPQYHDTVVFYSNMNVSYQSISRFNITKSHLLLTQKQKTNVSLTIVPRTTITTKLTDSYLSSVQSLTSLFLSSHPSSYQVHCRRWNFSQHHLFPLLLS